MPSEFPEIPWQLSECHFSCLFPACLFLAKCVLPIVFHSREFGSVVCVFQMMAYTFIIVYHMYFVLYFSIYFAKHLK